MMPNKLLCQNVFGVMAWATVFLFGCSDTKFSEESPRLRRTAVTAAGADAAASPSAAPLERRDLPAAPDYHTANPTPAPVELPTAAAPPVELPTAAAPPVEVTPVPVVEPPKVEVEPFSIEAIAGSHDAYKSKDIEFTLAAKQSGGNLPVDFKLLVGPKYGDIKSFDAASGKVVYRARPNTYGSDQLSFVAATSQGESAAGVVTLNIVNQPPVIADLKVSQLLNMEVVVKLAGGDADQDTLRYALGDLPEGIEQHSFDPATGHLRVKPMATFVGAMAIEISCQDEASAAKSAVLTLEFTDLPPRGEDLQVSTPMDMPVVITLSANEDARDDVLTYGVPAVIEHGTITGFDEAAGTLTFTPAKAYVGETSMHYSVTSKNGSGSGLVKITMRNAAPVTQAITASVDRNAKTPIKIDLKATSSDADGHRLAFALVGTPKHGVANLDPDTGLLTYLPTRNYYGLDSLSYTATDGGATSNTSLVSLNVVSPLSKIKPAIAVRGMACLMCHAAITSNVVTDFGYGDAFYLGGATDFTQDRNNWYNNNQNTWQSIRGIKGQLFIPNAPLPSGYKLQGQPLTTASGKTPAELVEILKGLQAGITPAPPVPSAPLTSLEQLLNFAYNNALDQGNNWYLRYGISGWLNPPQVNKAISAFVNPSDGKPAVVVNNSITIKAPSEADILASAPDMAAGVVGFQAVALPDASSPPPTPGFVVVNNVMGSFVTNPGPGPIVCRGDVVINGPLFLKQALIDTDQFGCRLYVTGSVFIEGGISYLNTSNNSNLQISSSRGIMMGIGTSPRPAYTGSPTMTPLDFRLSHKGAPLRNGLSVPGSLRPLILRDAEVIVASNGPLLDAQDAGSSAYAPASFTDPANTRNHAAIEYKALLLNAPVIESRYLGVFSGTVIAEVALFAVGHFEFQYDSAFDNPATPVLPLVDSVFLVQ